MAQPPKTPSPLRGDPPYQGDNGNKLPPSGGSPLWGERFKNKPPPPFGGIPLIRGTTANKPPSFGGGLPLVRGTTAKPPPPLRGYSPLSGGQRRQTSLIRGVSIPDREARRPRRGRAFCPPDKGGLRGVFFPIGKQGDSPEQTKPPPPCQGVSAEGGDNSKTPSPLRGYPPYQGDNNPPLRGRFHPPKQKKTRALLPVFSEVSSLASVEESIRAPLSRVAAHFYPRILPLGFCLKLHVYADA